MTHRFVQGLDEKVDDISLFYTLKFQTVYKLTSTLKLYICIFKHLNRFTNFNAIFNVRLDSSIYL